MTTTDLPPGLPPLPPVPPGFDRWEYRGESWSSGRYIQYAYFPSDLCNGWRVSTGEGCTAADIGTHYLEAVREPAEVQASGCHCQDCNPTAWWMIVCNKCGNKRCPHAAHHLNECTGSNAVGQVMEHEPRPQNRMAAFLPASGVEARVCSLEHKLAVAREALGCIAKGQSWESLTASDALARIDEKGTP